MSIEITGLEEMRARLRLLEQQVRTEYVVKAVKAGAQVIAAAMIENAPILDEKTAGSNALEPGALREDIKVRERLDKDGFAVATIGPTKRTGYVANFVEYGHRLVKGGNSKVLASGKMSGRGREIGFVPAQPFLRPAFERSEADAIEKFKASMQEQLARELQ